MGTLLKILLVGFGIYLLLRLLGGGRSKSPEVKRGRRKSKPDPFNKEDIMDVPYTEVPPDDEKEE